MLESTVIEEVDSRLNGFIGFVDSRTLAYRVLTVTGVHLDIDSVNLTENHIRKRIEDDAGYKVDLNFVENDGQVFKGHGEYTAEQLAYEWLTSLLVNEFCTNRLISDELKSLEMMDQDQVTFVIDFLGNDVDGPFDYSVDPWRREWAVMALVEMLATNSYKETDTYWHAIHPEWDD